MSYLVGTVNVLSKKKERIKMQFGAFFLVSQKLLKTNSIHSNNSKKATYHGEKIVQFDAFYLNHSYLTVTYTHSIVKEFNEQILTVK